MAKNNRDYESNYEPIIHGLSTQLEALARVLSRVEEVDRDQQDPIITPKDFVCIMQVFQEKLDSLKDLSASLDRAIEDDPRPIAAAKIFAALGQEPCTRRPSFCCASSVAIDVLKSERCSGRI